MLCELTRFLEHSSEKKKAENGGFLTKEREDEIFASPGNDILSKLPELLAVLEEEQNVCETLQQVLSIPDIQNLAIRIKGLGTEYDCSPVKKWGEELDTQVSSFNIEALPGILERFSEIVEIIRSLLSKNKEKKND